MQRVRPVRLSSQYVERIKVWPGDPGPAGRRAPGAVALSGEAPLSARELRAEASAHVRRRPSRPRIRPRACRAGGCQCLRASRLEHAKKTKTSESYCRKFLNKGARRLCPNYMHIHWPSRTDIHPGLVHELLSLKPVEYHRRMLVELHAKGACGFLTS